MATSPLLATLFALLSQETLQSSTNPLTLIKSTSSRTCKSGPTFIVNSVVELKSLSSEWWWSISLHELWNNTMTKRRGDEIVPSKGSMGICSTCVKLQPVMANKSKDIFEFHPEVLKDTTWGNDSRNYVAVKVKDMNLRPKINKWTRITTRTETPPYKQARTLDLVKWL